MKYSTLTEEQKASIIENHIAQVEQQHFSATVQLARVKTDEEKAQWEEVKTDLEAQREALAKFKADE